ncbi:MAG TPA: hypothetical protein VE058_00075 [Steroidobacteraceae bacterium]|nr:hypothetical protein [Steroidobacteraceae bacterium]
MKFSIVKPSIMKPWVAVAVSMALCAMSSSIIAVGDDDDKPADAGKQTAQASLSDKQKQAVGIMVARPIAAKTPERLDALGLVLDATTLLSDMGESTAAASAEHSASAELMRVRALFNLGAGASLKMLEAAQAEQAKAQAGAELTTARLALHWGPLIALPSGPRQKVLDAAVSGHELLVRADLPGRHSLGALPGKALLDVDGIQVPGRILGTLKQSSEAQSVALLLEIQNAPAGLGPGARVPVTLLTEQRSGLLLPRDAILYDESGAYVYKQLTAKAGDEKTHYAAVKVTLLVPYGDGWLVDGVDDDDNIVVRGAGVLWSLQGVGVTAPDDDD